MVNLLLTLWALLCKLPNLCVIPKKVLDPLKRESAPYLSKRGLIMLAEPDPRMELGGNTI